MVSLKATSRATTRRVVVFLIRLCATLKMCPFTINATTLQFESVQSKWARVAVYLETVLLLDAYTVYLLVTQGLIWTRHISTGSIVNNGMHFQFLNCVGIAAGLNMYVVVYERELVSMMNQFMRFWREFEEHHELTEKVSPKEQLLQVVLVVIMVCVPPACAVICIFDPYSTRYMGWLVKQLVPKPTWGNILLTSLTTFHYCVVGIIVPYFFIFVPTCFLIYQHKLSLWLKHIRDLPLGRASSALVVSSYHQVQILHCMVSHLIRPQLVPLGMLATYIFCVQFNFMFIVHHKNTPAASAVIYLEGSFAGVVLLVLAGQFAARIHIFSGQIVRRWTKYAKETGNEYLEARLKGCAPLSIGVGSFFKMTKTTAYKMVLFLVLNTFKAVLMFREKKRK